MNRLRQLISIIVSLLAEKTDDGSADCLCSCHKGPPSEALKPLLGEDYPRFLVLMRKYRDQRYQKIVDELKLSSPEDQRIEVLPRVMKEPIDESALCHDNNDIFDALAELFSGENGVQPTS